MTFSIHGIAVARGIAIGRAVIMGSGRADVVHYFIEPSQVPAEIERIRAGRNAVVEEIHRLQQTIAGMGPKEAPHELSALLDVHLMLLRAVSYRHEPLETLVSRAVVGGTQGVMQVAITAPQNQPRRNHDPEDHDHQQ